MNFSGSVPAKRQAAWPVRINRDAVSVAADLLKFIDAGWLLLAAYAASLLYSFWFAALAEPIGWDRYGPPVLLGLILAPFLLYERAVRPASLSLRRHLARFVLFAGALYVIGVLVRALDVPREWLGLWMLLTLALTSATRALLHWNLRFLEHRGVIAETVAVVGASSAAASLLQHLNGRARFELIGVFDDAPDAPGAGTIDELLELGKRQRIDWILLALPPEAQQRVPELLRRLKALSANIGICPELAELDLPCTRVDYVGDGVPVHVLTDRAPAHWSAPAGELVPRWVSTVLVLPGLLFELLKGVTHSRPVAATGRRRRRLVWRLDDYTLEQFTALAARPSPRFRYVVTPNADHLIRLHESKAFRAPYAAADYVLLDSRFIALLLRLLRGLRLPVCTGSDLTASLFERVIQPDDALVLIGGAAGQADELRARYGLRQLAHFNPPMGFIKDPRAVASCIEFIEAHSPFRFCLLAVGSPQQEILARELKSRGVARGMALCIGASVNFLTGDERRAPRWIQGLALEWLFRLLQAPGRMTHRYLVRGPRLFGLLRQTEVVLRPARAPIPVTLPAPALALPHPLTRSPQPSFAGALSMARGQPNKARARPKPPARPAPRRSDSA